MAQLQKGQSYPEMGFRVDDKGVAYDLTTGESLAKQTVDARLAQSGTGMSNLDKKRGGLNGFYDKNKGWVVPLAELTAGVLTGGAAVPALIGAGAGLNSIKNPNLKGAALGGVSGYGLGTVGAGVGGALSGATAPELGAVGSGASNVANATVPGTLGGVVKSGLSALPGVSSLPGALAKLGGSTSATSGNGVLDGLLGNALPIAQGVNVANLNRQSTEQAQGAIDLLKKEYAAKQGLRDKGIAGMMNPAQPNMAPLEGMRTQSNPFARPIPLTPKVG